jgi:hypothetical protein
MDDGLKKILALAWRSVPAIEANTAMLRARRATAAGEEAARRGQFDLELEESDDAPMARAYEVALAPDATLESFARDQLPRLVYHLESIGAHLPRPAGVVICMFAGDELFFIQPAELFATLCAELRVTPAELTERYGTHELRTAIRRDGTVTETKVPKGPPLALPGPAKA